MRGCSKNTVFRRMFPFLHICIPVVPMSRYFYRLHTKAMLLYVYELDVEKGLYSIHATLFTLHRPSANVALKT